MSNSYITQTSIPIALALSLIAGVASAQTAKSLTVRTWTHSPDDKTDVKFGDTQADMAFLEASNIIQTDSDGDDIFDHPCALWLSRSGDIEKFTTPEVPDGVATDRKEFNIIIGKGGFVKVVPSIAWCGVTAMSKGLASFAGCAPRGSVTGAPTNSMLVTEEMAKNHIWRGVLFGHEYGHVVGLRDSELPYNLMSGRMTLDSVMIPENNCQVWRRNDVDGSGPPGTVWGPPSPVHDADAMDYSKTPIETLAHSLLTAIPAEIVDFYGREDRETLRTMLRAEEERPYYGTIVTLLGLLSDGDKEDAASLIALLRDLSADSNSAVGYTQSSAIVSLGWLANRGNQEALAFLEELTAEEGPQTYNVWPRIGLAVAGTDRSRARLYELFRSGLPGTERLRGLIEHSDRMQSQGLRAYYDR